MKSMSLTRVCAAAGLVSLLASANAEAAVGQFTQPLLLSTVQTWSISGASETYVSFTTLPLNRPGCTDSTNVNQLYQLTGSVEQVRAATALATAAFLAGRQVKVSYESTCNASSEGKIKVFAIL